ncbi:lipoprotein-releasing ABC transporter permease subunit LolC [Orbus sturtevantii]|uniref:lipoprotein-releasing ABC transporter permease subunit LolC n=1 Tax=Orbus sturtevantii TaxID=3074109 RepID=UPI00370DA855
MFYPLSTFIGLRYAYSRKSDSFGRFVSWLSMIGIMLGSIGLIVIMSVMNGFENEMQKNILQYLPQAQIIGQANRLSTIQYPLTSIPTINQVDNIVPLVTADVILQSTKNITISTLIGIEPNQYDPISSRIYGGSYASLQQGKYNIILGRHLADLLNIDIGDTIRLMVPEVSQITPVGKIPSQRIFNVSALFAANRDIEQSVVYLNIDDAAKLMRYPPNTITSWRLYLNNPLNIESIVTTKLPEGLHFDDWRAKRGELFQAISMEKNVMGLLISLIVIVAAFNIITSLSLLVMEKQNEIAILKTQGLTHKGIMMIFIIQGASSGVVGTVLGCLIGLFISYNLSDIMSTLGLTFSGIRLPSVVDITQVVIVFIALLMLSIVSTLYPAYRAAKTQPAEALRYE